VRALGLDGGGDYWVPPATGGGGGGGVGGGENWEEGRTDAVVRLRLRIARRRIHDPLSLPRFLRGRGTSRKRDSGRRAAGRRMLPACLPTCTRFPEIPFPASICFQRILPILPPYLNMSIFRFPCRTFGHSSYSKEICENVKNNYGIFKI
jgi:hypothetical protein